MDATDRSPAPSSVRRPSSRRPDEPIRIVSESPPISVEDVADAAAARSALFARETANGVAVVDGMGARLYVRRGALVIDDGLAEDRRTRVFDKATHGLSRVVVCASTGTWTLEALH